LVRSTLRLRPDRIVVGEVRGPEALDLLKAWNTGHRGGIATLHANSASAALARLEQLTMEVCETPPRALIAEAIDLIVFVERGGPAGRRLPEILAPKGMRPQAPDPIVPRPGARGAKRLGAERTKARSPPAVTLRPHRSRKPVNEIGSSWRDSNCARQAGGRWLVVRSGPLRPTRRKVTAQTSNANQPR
jgi:hypothetical protein